MLTLQPRVYKSQCPNTPEDALMISMESGRSGVVVYLLTYTVLLTFTADCTMHLRIKHHLLNSLLGSLGKRNDQLTSGCLYLDKH